MKKRGETKELFMFIFNHNDRESFVRLLERGDQEAKSVTPPSVDCTLVPREEVTSFMNHLENDIVAEIQTNEHFFIYRVFVERVPIEITSRVQLEVDLP